MLSSALLFGNSLCGFRDHVGGKRVELSEQYINLLAGHWCDVHFCFGGFFEELGILHRIIERPDQRRLAVVWDIRWSRKRATDGLRGEMQGENSAS